MGSQRTTEELFEMSVSVTATLLISVRGLVGASERLRQSQQKKKKKRLVEAEESVQQVYWLRVKCNSWAQSAVRAKFSSSLCRGC